MMDHTDRTDRETVTKEQALIKSALLSYRDDAALTARKGGRGAGKGESEKRWQWTNRT